MADATRAALLSMGMDEVLIERAVKLHPTDVAAAVDYCFNPQPELESSNLPAIGTWGISEQQYPQTNASARLAEDTPMAPPSSPPSRPVKQATFQLPDENNDDELQRALKMSMEAVTGDSHNDAGWSATTGSRNFDQTYENKGENRAIGPVTATGAGPLVLRSAPHAEDDEMQRAIELSLAETSSNVAETGKSDDEEIQYISRETYNNSFEEWQSPMAQLRGYEADSPVALRTSSKKLSFVCSVLQSLYALQSFRQTIMSLPLGTLQQPPKSHTHFTYANYWRGNLEWDQSPIQAGSKEHQIAIVLALQRLFVYMTHTKRKFLNVADMISTLQIPERSDMLTSPVGYAQDTMDTIIKACLLTFESLYEQSINDGQDSDLAKAELAKRRQTFETSGKPISLRFLETAMQEGKADFSLDATYGSDVLPIQKANAVALVPDPPDNNDLHACLDAALSYNDNGKPFYTFLARPYADHLCFTLNRTGEPSQGWDFGQVRKAFKLEECIYLDRYTFERKSEILQAKQMQTELATARAQLLEQRRSYTEHSNYNIVTAAQSILRYIETAQTTDDKRAQRLEQIKLKAQNMKSLIEERISTVEGQIKANEKESIDLLSQWQNEPRYKLSAVSFWSGAGPLIFTYFRAGGKWYKMLDGELYDAVFWDIENDNTGIHMRAGSSVLLYSLSDQAVESPVSAQLLVDAVNADNHAFKDQCFANAPEITAGWNLAPLVEPPPDTIPSIESQVTDKIMEAPTPTQESVTASTEMQDLQISETPRDEPPAVNHSTTTGVEVSATTAVEAVDQLPVISMESPAVHQTGSSTIAGGSPDLERDPPTCLDAPTDETLPVGAPFTPAGLGESPQTELVPEQIDEISSHPAVIESSPPTIDSQGEINTSTINGNTTLSSEDLEVEANLVPALSSPRTSAVTNGHDHTISPPDTGNAVEIPTLSDDGVEIAVGESYDGPALTFTHFENRLGRIGGKPLWVKPDRPLTLRYVKCHNCHDSMRFLMQITASSSESSDIIKRVLYVYICVKQECLDASGSEAIRVYRIQIFHDTPLFPREMLVDPSERSDVQTAIVRCAVEYASLHDRVLCEQCGLSTEGHDGECSNTRWPESKIAMIVKPLTARRKTKSSVFPPWFPPLSDRRESRTHYSRLQKGSLELLQQHRRQIFRYYGTSGRLDTQIWPGGVPPTHDIDKVPPCPLCGADRTLEIQTAPYLLELLYRNASADDGRLVFGTIAIYTCSQECRVESSATFNFGVENNPYATAEDYAEEFVVYQGFSAL